MPRECSRVRTARRPDETLDVAGRLGPVNETILRPTPGVPRCPAVILRSPGHFPARESRRQLRRHLLQHDVRAGNQLGRIVVRQYRYRTLGDNVARVGFVRQKEQVRRRGLIQQNGPGHRRSPATLRQRRGVEAHRTLACQTTQIRRDKL
jgi:hypothetical protein